MDFVKCLAKCSFADRKGTAEGRNMKRLIQIGESKLLCALDENVARRVGPRRGHFRRSCDPAMDGHRKPPTSRAGKQAHLGATQHRGRPGDIVLRGRPGVAQSRAARDVDIRLYGVAPVEGVVVNNPTRSAMETASAND